MSLFGQRLGVQRGGRDCHHPCQAPGSWGGDLLRAERWGCIWNLSNSPACWPLLQEKFNPPEKTYPQSQCPEKHSETYFLEHLFFPWMFRDFMFRDTAHNGWYLRQEKKHWIKTKCQLMSGNLKKWSSISEWAQYLLVNSLCSNLLMFALKRSRMFASDVEEVGIDVIP